MHCFERAGMEREVAVSNAYSLREQARTANSVDRQNTNTPSLSAFLAAGNAFLECASAATTESRAYFRIAGDCFVSGENLVTAARAYVKAEEYTLAAKLYRKAGKFDEAVSVITAFREKIPTSVAESILNVACLIYFKDLELESA